MEAIKAKPSIVGVGGRGETSSVMSGRALLALRLMNPLDSSTRVVHLGRHSSMQASVARFPALRPEALHAQGREGIR